MTASVNGVYDLWYDTYAVVLPSSYVLLDGLHARVRTAYESTRMILYLYEQGPVKKKKRLQSTGGHLIRNRNWSRLDFLILSENGCVLH